MRVLTNYYQQFDADFERDVPAEGYGGWKKGEIDIDPAHIAVALMHAWNCGTREEYPGWHRVVDYIPRSYDICRNVLPDLLTAVRQAKFNLFHVVSAGDYYKHFPGYKEAVENALPEPPKFAQVDWDPTIDKLVEFKRQNVFPGPHNTDDIGRGWKKVNFPKEAEPQGDEGVAENAQQLYGLCKKRGVNHLIYCGFAVNWCLFYSAGGMLDMERHGCVCSVFRDAVTAVENKETARQEWGKQTALWRISIQHGFVFDSADFIAALGNASVLERREAVASR